MPQANTQSIHADSPYSYKRKAKDLLSQGHWQLLFAGLWAILMSVCLAWHFVQSGWFVDRALLNAIAPYSAGAFLGGYIGLFASCLLVKNRAATARFCLCFIMLAGFSTLITLIIFILQYRLYFSQWHADFLSITWGYQVVFTAAGSFVLFLLSGLRPLVPWCIVLLLCASYAFSRGWLPGSR